jgi:putative phosphoribosyl transferase
MATTSYSLPFADRQRAGKVLGEALEAWRTSSPAVLALPRGGVPVGLEVARALRAPLDVLVVRKLGAPLQPELAVGAIAAGVTFVDPRLAAATGATETYLARCIEEERRELARREAAYRGDRPPLAVTGRTIIVVDDGLATGATARAAVRALRQAGAARVIVAAPVGSPDSVESLRTEADAVVCLHTPPWFRAVGEAYSDFSQTSDAEVRACLEEAEQWTLAPSGGRRDATAPG